ncbi:MAG: helix-turn-helix domain-containing protein [Methanobacteriota archaeon]
MSILDLISLPESKTLEFKEKMPESLAIAKTACAFANGGGGTILIGVADKKKTITGINEQEIHILEEKIANIVYTMVEPTAAFYISIHNIEGKLILKIDVFPGSLKPYHLKNKGEIEGTYIRVGSTNRMADLETIEELGRQRMNISFDETSIIDATIDDIDLNNIEIYLKKRKEVRDIPEVKPDGEFLKKIKAARQQNGSIHPTVAGILLFSSEPEKYIQGAVIKCARFKGNEMDEFIDQRIITGSLFSQIEETIAFFKKNVKRSAKIEGVYRKEEYEYPEKAIREAVVNAVCHRDYSRKGADIKFAIFDDRIEITSPGGLLPQISLSDLGTGVSELRNKIIGRIFNEAGLIEGWGTGIRRIRNEIEEMRLMPPEFKDINSFFKTIIYNEPLKKSVKLDTDENEIIAYIQKQGKASTKELEKKLGKSKATIKRKIRTLIDNGYLIWVGKSQKDPSGYYELTGSKKVHM